MNSNELKPKIDTKEEALETYTNFKKRYYIYRTDDIVDYIQTNDSELQKLYQKETEIFNDLQKTLNPTQKSLLSKYSDNWLELLNEQTDELTQYILKDFEEER